MNASRSVRFVMLWSVMLLPAAAWTQSSGAGTIAGVVRDTSGAVMPGVTVEAASPALIEKVRAVVTDERAGYGLQWLTPYEIMGGRLFKFSTQFEF